MARFQKAKAYGRKAYGYARRGATYRRTFAHKSGYGVTISTPFLVGMAVGLTDLDNNIPGEIKILAATLPVKGPGVQFIKTAAQGMILGDVVQKMTGFGLPLGNLLGNKTATSSGNFGGM